MLHNNKLETTAKGALFLPMPFVKSYCTKTNDNQIDITAANYKGTTTNQSIHAIFFLNLLLDKIPANLKNYLPDNMKDVVSNIKSLNVSVTKSKGQVILNCIVQKLQDDLPLFNF